MQSTVMAMSRWTVNHTTRSLLTWPRGYEISAMIGCLRTRVRKQPIIALYYEFETVPRGQYSLHIRSLVTPWIGGRRRMPVEHIWWSICTKVWGWNWIELMTPESATSCIIASDCATKPGWWAMGFRYLTRMHRGGSRSSGKGVHMYKGVGVRFADFISFLLNIPWKWNNLISLRPNYFFFYRIFKNGGQRGVSSEPLTPPPPLDPPLMRRCLKWMPMSTFLSYSTSIRYNYHLYGYNVSSVSLWAISWDFQQCGMCDQQRLRPACAYAQSDQSLC